MKRISILFLLTLFMSMMGINAFAQYVENADGVRIYFNFYKNYYHNDATEVEVVHPSANGTYEGDVVIPEEVTYLDRIYKVTRIGRQAFYGSSGLTSVTIPNSVMEICPSAFKGCTSLTSVTIPNSVKYIEEGAFVNCSGLTSVTIPDGQSYIGTKVFMGCTSLTSVTIPNSVKVIYEGAFSGCTSLTSVILPNSVKYIDEGAFQYCTSLTSVTLNNVEYIMFSAFQGCRSLTSVTLPSSVKEIGTYAFYGSKLSTIVSLIEDPFPIVGKGRLWSTFSDDTFSDATLYVPVGSVEKYKTKNGWKDFSHIVPLDEGMSVKVMENDNNSPSNYYLLNGQQVDQPQKGLTIVKTGKKAVKVLVK